VRLSRSCRASALLLAAFAACLSLPASAAPPRVGPSAGPAAIHLDLGSARPSSLAEGIREDFAAGKLDAQAVERRQRDTLFAKAAERDGLSQGPGESSSAAATPAAPTGDGSPVILGAYSIQDVAGRPGRDVVTVEGSTGACNARAIVRNSETSQPIWSTPVLHPSNRQCVLAEDSLVTARRTASSPTHVLLITYRDEGRTSGSLGLVTVDPASGTRGWSWSSRFTFQSDSNGYSFHDLLADLELLPADGNRPESYFAELLTFDSHTGASSAVPVFIDGGTGAEHRGTPLESTGPGVAMIEPIAGAAGHETGLVTSHWTSNTELDIAAGGLDGSIAWQLKHTVSDPASAARTMTYTGPDGAPVLGISFHTTAQAELPPVMQSAARYLAVNLATGKELFNRTLGCLASWVYPAGSPAGRADEEIAYESDTCDRLTTSVGVFNAATGADLWGPQTVRQYSPGLPVPNPSQPTQSSGSFATGRGLDDVSGDGVADIIYLEGNSTNGNGSLTVKAIDGQSGRPLWTLGPQPWDGNSAQVYALPRPCCDVSGRGGDDLVEYAAVDDRGSTTGPIQFLSGTDLHRLWSYQRGDPSALRSQVIGRLHMGPARPDRVLVLTASKTGEGPRTLDLVESGHVIWTLPAATVASAGTPHRALPNTGVQGAWIAWAMPLIGLLAAAGALRSMRV
jgi:hypothetical protein